MAVIDDLVSSGLSGTQATEVIAVGAGTSSDAALVSQGFSTAQATQILAAKNGAATEADLVRQGLFGTQASAVMSAVASAPAPAGTTYTQGVDYNTGALTISTNGPKDTLTIMPADWTNTAALASILAQPSGTVYTMVIDGSPYTITTDSTWDTVDLGPFVINPASVGSTVPGTLANNSSFNITSVTFSPA